jgi:hypothetical protein
MTTTIPTALPVPLPLTLFTPKPTAVIAPKQRPSFLRYLNERYRQYGAVTPEERLKVLLILKNELILEGNFPYETSVIQVPVQHPVVRAILAGQPVNLGSGVIGGEKRSVRDRMQTLGTGAKLTLIAVVGMTILLAVWGGAVLLQPRPASAVAAAPPTSSVTVTASQTPVASVTPFPVTATPYSIAFITGDAASQVYDPASLELGGFSYVLSVGQVRNGEWAPTGAEWLYGTALRRVIAIPYEPDLVRTLTEMTPGTVIHLRLRNGEVVKYRVTQVGRVPRQQIEVMVDRQPSIAVILHGEPTPDRWVLVGEAIQEIAPQGADTALLPPLPEASPALSGTLPVTNTTPIPLTPTIPVAMTPPVAGGSALTTVMTDTLPLFHPHAGITLEVNQCQRLNRIGDQNPPQRRQQFVLCHLILTAAPTNTVPVPYTAEAFALSEYSWFATSTDWWPPSVSVSGSLRSGTLNPGMSTTGRIGGLLLRTGGTGSAESNPVLVWEQAGTRYLLTLPESVWQP